MLETSVYARTGRQTKDAALAKRVWEICSSRRTARQHGMPFTVGFLQRQAHRGFGVRMGEKRAAAAIRELQRKNVLTPTGNYRSKRHGFRVTVYLLPQVVASVRKRRAVKVSSRRQNWWEHPLFGEPGGPKALGVSENTGKRWRSPLWHLSERLREEQWEGERDSSCPWIVASA